MTPPAPAVQAGPGPARALKTALWYARHGLPCFPLRAGTKYPACKWGTEATTDQNKLRKLFNGHQDFNLGIAVPPGLVLVDVDGPAALRALAHTDRELPETARQRTPHGMHYLYRVPDGVELRQTAGEIAQGVDTRTAGRGYFVAYPSEVGGLPYAWELHPGCGEDRKSNIADAPAWLLDALRVERPRQGNGNGPIPQQPRVDMARVLAGVPEGQRDTEIFRMASKLRRADVPQEAAAELALKAAANSAPPLGPQQALAKVASAYGRYDPAPHPPAAAPRPTATPRLRRMSEVEPETMRFLWEPYLPEGSITILEGDPGEGKSFIAAALATAGSLGRGLPGVKGIFDPWITLLCTAEDSLEHVVSRRLADMQADQGRIFACGERFYVDTPEYLATLREWIVKVRPRLVVIDPLVAYISGNRDTNRANQVRDALTPLAELAREFDLAILIVRHLSKGQQGRPIYRGQGSIDFTATARSQLLAGSKADDKSLTGIVHVKSNYGAKGPSIRYHLDGGRFEWSDAPCDLAADDILKPEPDGEEKSALRAATEYLRERLGDGSRIPAKEMEDDARAQGISKATLHRAKKALDVKSEKQGYGAGKPHLWWWPGASAAPPGGCTTPLENARGPIGTQESP
jgi:DNA repair protein RadA/Sms